MIDVSNRVLSNIKSYVKDTCKNVSNYSSKSPPSFRLTIKMLAWTWKTVRMLSSP